MSLGKKIYEASGGATSGGGGGSSSKGAGIVPIVRVDHVYWDSSKLNKHTKAVRRKFLNRVGAATRKTAKRMLRKARKVRVSELPDDDREEYRDDLAEFRAGLRDKPELGDIISSPGSPPLLHQNPSPLKKKLLYKVNRKCTAVVIGPARAKDGVAGHLEFGRGKVKKARPFMKPAIDKIRPKLPEYLRSATKARG